MTGRLRPVLHRIGTGDRSGTLFGGAYALFGFWALVDSVWLATGFLVVAAGYVTTAFSRRANDFLRGSERRRGGVD